MIFSISRPDVHLSTYLGIYEFSVVPEPLLYQNSIEISYIDVLTTIYNIQKYTTVWNAVITETFVTN